MAESTTAKGASRLFAALLTLSLVAFPRGVLCSDYPAEGAGTAPSSDGVRSDTGAPSEAPAEITETPSTESLEGQPGSSETSWLDRFHLALSSGVQSRAEWFDSFFGDEQLVEEKEARTFIRLSFSHWKDELEGVGSKTSLTAHVTLPKAADRLNLFFGADEEEEPQASNFTNPVDHDRGVTTDVALRYNLVKTSKARLSTSLGVNYPLYPFVKIRYRYDLRFTGFSSLRFIETVYHRADPEREGWEGVTQVDLNRNLDPSSLLRWSNRGSRSQFSSEGWSWSSYLQFFHSLSAKNALRYEAGLSGVTQPDNVIDRYVVRSQFRRNFYREWLYYELEPELSWRRDDLGYYETAGRFTVRLEVQFQGGGSK